MDNGLKRERLRMRGRLVEEDQKMRELAGRLATLRGAMRDELDPLEGDLGRIDGESVANMAIEFSQKQISYRETRKRVDAIKEALG